MINTPLSPAASLFVVVTSFAIASVFNIYPMSLNAANLRPMALVMVLAFWLIYKPDYIGVGVAFTIGIIADLLLDTRLGQQSFAAVIMAFTIRFICIYIRELSLPVVWMVASIGLVVFQLTLWLVQYITQNIFIASSIWGLLISIVTWPLVYFALIRVSK